MSEHFHTHKDEKGILHKCYHETKSLLGTWQFWIGTLIAFPLEHFLYEKVPPFTFITHWLGL